MDGWGFELGGGLLAGGVMCSGAMCSGGWVWFEGTRSSLSLERAGGEMKGIFMSHTASYQVQQLILSYPSVQSNSPPRLTVLLTVYNQHRLQYRYKLLHPVRCRTHACICVYCDQRPELILITINIA